MRRGGMARVGSDLSRPTNLARTMSWVSLTNRLAGFHIKLRKCCEKEHKEFKTKKDENISLLPNKTVSQEKKSEMKREMCYEIFTPCSVYFDYVEHLMDSGRVTRCYFLKKGYCCYGLFSQISPKF